jgi:magnesium-transporting ATPase (P-type)
MVVKLSNNKVRVFMKGASEIVLERCSHLIDQEGNLIPISNEAKRVPQDLLEAHETNFSADHHQIFLRAIDKFARQALRTLLLCYKDYSMADYE